jgi:hypothetical protein
VVKLKGKNDHGGVGKLMDKRYVAYKGEFFTIEWYFNTQGKSAAT